MTTYLTNPDDRMLNDCVLTLTNEGALYPTFCAMARDGKSTAEWLEFFNAKCMPVLVKAGGACRYGLRREVANRLRLYYADHVNEA